MAEHNILVISDLHLGEDLRPGVANVSYLRHLVKLERELEAFLGHYADPTSRIDGRPWTLVVNGDMVDFMSIMLQPGATDEVDDAEDEKLYGLGFGERQSQKKLEKVIVRHQGVFGKLAEFVGAGNELVIVVGNHDPEFQYPSVQRTLVEWLCGLAVGAGASPEAREAFARRISFCPWFFYREDLIYVEHGHQYDEYCSFDYVLHPVASRARGGRKSAVALSIAHAGMRYFANQLPETYDPRTAEHWSVWDYARWAFAQGLRGMVRLSYLYGILVWRVVEIWYWLRHADAERRAVHHERLRALSRDWQIAEDKLIALDALKRSPVTRRLWGLLSALFIDRMLLGGVALAVATVCALRLPGAWRVVAPVGTLIAFGVVNQLLNRVRLESSAVKLRASTKLIQGLICAPFIVFGHSHAPEAVKLPSGATYFNTGTWASDDPEMSFTHVIVTRGADGTRGELRQWRDGGSQPFAVPSPQPARQKKAG
jgi:UDP-2,3-diacylglucosamine pyrophosphatase LpxH